MQVSFIRPLLLLTASLYGFTASADVIEKFNSRKGSSIHDIKSDLQRSCWSFFHFDVNINGWNPKIEGDGAMVADINSLHYDNAGIYTPLLKVGSELSVSFEYRFNSDFDAASARWIKICLADASNQIVRTLETIQIIGINATKNKKYSTQFNNIDGGEYRLVLLYGGKGGDAIIAIDELSTNAPYKYAGGCNSSPAALRDNVTGMANRTASGSVLANDVDKNGEAITAYLIKNSADGTVALNEDGTFTFTPNKNFKGNSTTFVYKVCDESNLCSPDATVTIDFPSASFSEFSGSYKYDGNVEIAWNIRAGSNIKKFELERSIEGSAWEKAGSIPVKQSTAAYRYVDNVGKNTALKKDLYYRLKQVNTDGSVAASRLLIVRVYNTKTVSMISVTPNPSRSDIGVNVQLHEPSVVAMRIIDANGGTILHKIVNAEKGTSNILFDGSSKLTPGIYDLEVIVNSKERMVVKLIKE